MSYIIEISDISAPELDPYARLTERQLRNARNPEDGIFIAESATVIGHALDAGYSPVSLLMEREQITQQGADIVARCGEIPIYTADSSVLSQLTGYALTRGFLCAMRRPVAKTVAEVCQNARRVVVLEGIVDPTNVGAIMRSAAALHMDAVLVSPTCCDPLHRRAVRVSMGTVFQIPWAQFDCGVSEWPTAGLDTLRNLGFKSVAMALDDHAISIEDAKLASEDRLALFMGTEGSGLTSDTIAGCDYTAIIPMSHGVNSLNVAAASAVAFWQLRIK